MSILLFPGFIIVLIIVFCYECKIRKLSIKSKNKVHFYVARDKNGELSLYLGKPVRKYTEFCGDLTRGSIYLTNYNFNKFGLNKDDYDRLRWEDGPIEVFVNMED